MTILCIDTATDDGTVAVAPADRAVASVRWHSAGRHGENLFGYINTALSEAGASREELSLIGAVIGPGKFTSLRVGLGTAKGIAFGLGLPIVGVSSLRVLSRAIVGEPEVIRVPVMNAYRGDVFSAAYIIEDGGIIELTSPLFGPPARVFGQLRDAVGGRPVLVAGQDLRAHAALIESLLEAQQVGAPMSGLTSTATAIVEEVKYVMQTAGPADLDSLEPQYLRPSDAKVPKHAPPTQRPR